jgi:hypothetical protein
MDFRFDLLLRYSSSSLQGVTRIRNHLLKMEEENCNGRESSNPQECCGTRIITPSEAESLITILCSISDEITQVRRLLENFV